MGNIASRFLKLLAACVLGERWNVTISESRQQCGDLFKDANKSIRIVSGELQHDLFDNDQVLSTFEDLSTREKNPVTIEIIYGPKPDPKSKRIFKLSEKSKGRLNMMQVPVRPKSHFILVDDNKFRIERYHRANTPERMAYTKTSKPVFLHRILSEKFEDLKAACIKS